MFFKSLIPVVCFVATFSAAAQITPIEQKDISGGASCAIVNKKGDVIIDDKVNMNGSLVAVKQAFVSNKSKSFEGKDFKAVFVLAKGKLQETSDGGFSVGKSPVGQLKFNYKGVEGVMDAREECFGAE